MLCYAMLYVMLLMTFNSCVLWTFRQVAQQQINPTC